MNKRVILAVGVTAVIMLLYAYFYNQTRERAEPEELGADPDEITNEPATTEPVTNLPVVNQPNTMTQLTEQPNFKVSEFACNDGTPVPAILYPNVSALMKNLQALRNRTGLPIHINSGYRTPAHNAKVGGKKNSLHLRAMAADIVILGMSPREVKSLIELMIKEGKMQQGGIGLYPSFVHYDIRGTAARW